MLRLPDIDLEEAAAEKLKEWQLLVNDKATFPEQVTEAKEKFKARNTKDNATFKVVRSTLARMHGDLIRCAYCEDSKADEVEHLYPKDMYPERVFSWENYTYACGPCNGPKNNNFSIFRTTDGVEVDIAPPRRKPANWIPVAPPAGDTLLIDPRREDPLALLWLDLLGTARIDPVLDLSQRDYRRAKYTIALLGLNRDFLLRARRNALTMACDTFSTYSQLKADHAPQPELDKRRDAIRTMVHRTVWKEMIRQRTAFPAVDEAFRTSPEALEW